ncbi:MAG: hypothetical protein ACQES1_09355 [Bacteroidota bacterium]
MHLIIAARRRRIPCRRLCLIFCTADRVTGETPVLQHYKNRHRRWEVAGRGGDKHPDVNPVPRCPNHIASNGKTPPV